MIDRKSKIPGRSKSNELIFEMLNDNDFYQVLGLANTMLKNPYIDFQEACKKAKTYLDSFPYGADIPPHSDPYIQKIIDATDEEFNEMLKEAMEKGAYWEGKTEKSFLSLFVTSLLDKNKQAKPESEEDEPDNSIDIFDELLLSDYPRPSAKEVRRTKALPAKVERINNMRDTMLKNVVGQDHIIHAFAEGIFNSEVFSETDVNRKGPKAIFTFAGPPGVGKTFIAEQAAELLGLPSKRFDMTNYSGPGTQEGLVGFDYTWKNATPGLLTSYVRDNPDAILIFDEIEKAHPTVIQLFYQILDAGVLADKYYETMKVAAQNNSLEPKHENAREEIMEIDPNVSFKDTIIIFTSNAGCSLYEGDYKSNAASVSRKVLLKAFETEISPVTNQPFFPAAITSRLGTGYPLMFGHLQAHHLVEIISMEFDKCRALMEKEYDITINADKNVFLSLLFSEGGNADARTLTARTRLFFKNEVFKLLSVKPNFLSNVTAINFDCELENIPDKTRKLFYDDEKPDILLYTEKAFELNCRKFLEGYKIYAVNNADEAIDIIQKYEVDFAIIDIAHRNTGEERQYTGDADPVTVSFGSKSFQDGKRLFMTLTETVPELPIYLLETIGSPINEELLAGFMKLGARGKVVEPFSDMYNEFNGQLLEIGRELYMQRVAEKMAAERKMLAFETAPEYIDGKLTVCLRNYEFKRIIDAEDTDDVLNDAEKPKERFSDIIGAESAKKELGFFVNYLRNPQKFMAQGHRLPKGVLLHGAPGTGKTMLAKALAGESEVTFIPAVASSFVNTYTGSGPAAVRTLFKKARRYAPAIVFIDEVDAIGRQRTGGVSSVAEENTLNALLAEMDGFAVDPKRPVFVLAATNYRVDTDGDGIGMLDEAFMRRFDRKILIELPNKKEREQLLRSLLSKTSHCIPDNIISDISARSIGMSPAILTNMLETAKRMAFDKNEQLNGEILTEAFEITKFGEKKKWSAEYLERVARHEAGHAIMSYLCGNTPAYLTIEARGKHGGYMEHSEEVREREISTRSQILDRIRISLGGRGAEIVYYGDEDGVSTGPSGDLAAATNMARNMIIAYGMDEQFGLATMGEREALDSERLQDRVNGILREQMSEVLRILRENKDKIDILVGALMEKNKLAKTEIEELLKGEENILQMS